MKKAISDMETAKNLHQNGCLDEAKEMYLALVKINPGNAEVWDALGILYAQQDHISEAIECLEKALHYQPDHPVFSLHFANLLKAQGLFSRAADVLEGLAQTHPDYVPALNNLGTVYYAQGKFNEAASCYQTVLLKQPGYLDAYYNLALVQTKQNKLLEAIEAFKKLLDYAPEHAAALFLLGCVYMQLDDIEPAKTAFLAAEKIQPHHFETQTNLATCYLKRGDLTQAKLHYMKALDLKANDTQILFNLGFISMQLGQADHAIQYYQRAVILNPDFFAAHNNLGVALIAKQHSGLALQHFKEALRLQPGNKHLQYTIAALSKDKSLLAAPVDYVKTLFDAYADHYEPHLLTALDYKIPTVLFQAVLQATTKKTLAILDLGCGTGLCGEAFQPIASRIAGVDVSEKMLAIAAVKNIYEALIAEDISDYLATTTSRFDLVIAGDVFVYTGELADIFARVRNVLVPEGLFVFNTEICEIDHYKMNQSGRFSHSKEYLDQLVKDHGFDIVSYQVEVTRMQHNEPVFGHIYVCRSIE